MSAIATLVVVAIGIAARLDLADRPIDYDSANYAYVATHTGAPGSSFLDFFNNKPPGIYAWYRTAFALFGASVACSAAPDDAEDAPTEVAASGEEATATSADAFSISTRKRDYCCIMRDNSLGVVQACRGFREYRNEVGHLNAQNKCHHTEPSNWARNLVRGNCADIPECPR